MAKIKNTVDIDVKERGSAKAAKGIEGVTKAQTRQTNAGVSSAKQLTTRGAMKANPKLLRIAFRMGPL